MTTVLLFAEHELTQAEVTRTLEALAELRLEGERPVDVSVLVPYRAHWPATLALDVAAARGMSASGAIGDSRHEAAVSTTAARRTLQHCLAAVRGGGHVARGELVAVRDAVRDLAMEATARETTAAVIVSPPHHLSHLLRRDLEHRLRHAGVGRVVRVDGVAANPSYS